MTLGQDPAIEELVLVRGTDWTWGWDTTEGTEFEAGTELHVTIREPDDTVVTYHAAMTSTSARFKIEAEVADLIPDKSKFTLTFQLPTTPTTEIPYFVGKVKRKDYA